MAKIEVSVGAKTTAFTSALDKMRAQAEGFSQHLSGLGSKVAGGFVAANIFDKALEKISETIDAVKQAAEETKSLSTQLDESADSAQRLAYAAKMAGVDASELAKAMLHVRQLAGEAQKGNPDAAETFSKLGIDPKILATQDAAHQVQTLAAAFEELKGKGDRVAVMLEAVGTKNREMLRVFESGPKQLQSWMEQASPLGENFLAHMEAMRQKSVATSARRAQQVAESGTLEIEAELKKTTGKVTDALLETLGKVHDASITINRSVGGNQWLAAMINPLAGMVSSDATTTFEAREAAKGDALRAPVSSGKNISLDFEMYKQLGLISERNDSARTAGSAALRAGRAAHDALRAGLTGTGDARPTWANASTRAAAAEKLREADARNDLLFQADPAARANALKAEQLRIFEASMKESNPNKALELLLKGKGMEGEIFSAMRALGGTDMLTVRGSKLAEMGGGGPVAAFGGVEIKLQESNNLLRDIRDALRGSANNYTFDAKTGQVQSAFDMTPYAGLARTITKAFNSDGER